MSPETFGLIAVGIVLGILSSILPLGPVTVLVVRRSLAADHRGALKIGLGRVVPECIYCGLAAFGITALLDRFPDVRVGIEGLGTVLFLVIGIWLWVQDPRPPTSATGEEDEASRARRQRWGDWSGFIISALNPTLILSWSAGIAIAMSMLRVEPTTLDKLIFPVALGVGIVLGYLILVDGLRRWGERIGDHLLRWILRAMAVVFILTAIANGLRLVGVLD